MVGTYIKLFLVVLHSETGLPHPSFPVGSHTMGRFPNSAQGLLLSDSPNSLISLYCSGYTPATMEFPTDPGISTSMSLRYFQAILGFFQNARCITVGRSSPASAVLVLLLIGRSAWQTWYVPRRYARALLAPLPYVVLIWASSP